MNTIVMNTLNGAVTEYDWAFQSITPTQAGDAAGLYTFGGSLDNASLVVSRITTGSNQWGASFKKFIEMIYFAIIGSGEASMFVNDYEYSFPVRDSGESRCQPGKGIRENYLSFGFSNPSGESFRLDKIEVAVVASTTRRV